MAQPKLSEDMDFIQRAPLEITTLDGDLNIIAKLDDEPNDVGGLSSAELKAEFDKAGNAIKTYLNDTLIPELLAADAVEQSRVEAEQNRVAAEQGRVTAEQGRVTAEQDRAAAEQNRVTAEQSRVTAEESRAAAEDARSQAEAARAEAEQRREHQETGYVAQAAASASHAKSWAVGGTGTRAGEETDNSRYYSEQAHSGAAKATDSAAQSAYHSQQSQVSAGDAEKWARIAQSEAEGLVTPPAVPVYNLILQDRADRSKYVLIVEDGRLVLVGVDIGADGAEPNFIDRKTGTEYRLAVENKTLKLEEV